MSQAQDEISELMALQRESAELRAKARKARPKTESAGPAVSPEAGEKPESTESESAAADERGMSDLEKKINEISDDLETAVQEIEEAAKEQPALTALVAFTLGIVVGQMLSRR